MRCLAVCSIVIGLFLFANSRARCQPGTTSSDSIDVTGFYDSAHHWYDIQDEDHVIDPLRSRKRYSPVEVRKIAENILLYQKDNGGWPKNYDMLAVLTSGQKRALIASRNLTNTTFDNGATYSQIEYLAKAYAVTGETRFRDASLKGMEFILRAQYPNGGWPQFYPLRKGYSSYITFNDDAMVGAMRVLKGIVDNKPWYSFVDTSLRARAKCAFDKGVDCILKCQIMEQGKPTAWCQQHDDQTLKPSWARTFEPPSVSSFESADIVMFLMSIDHPEPRLIKAIEGAVEWIDRSKLFGIRVDSVPAAHASYRYHTTDFDVVVVRDDDAPPTWARYYELGSNRPLFCNRRGGIVYSLAEVDRERRTGYRWYGSYPDEALRAYPAWRAMWCTEGEVSGDR